MRVNTESNYTNILAELIDFKTGLDGLSGTYTVAIGDMNSNRPSVSLTNWDDAIARKFEDFINNCLFSGIDTIDSDISSGSYSKLKETVNSLEQSLKNCKELQEKIKEKRNELSSVSNNSSIDEATRESQKSTLNSSISRYETSFNEQIATCNTLLERLETIRFNHATTPTPSVEALDLSGIDTGGTTGDGEYREYPNRFNNEMERLYVVHADFNDGQGEVDHYFYSQESYEAYKAEADLVAAMHRSQETGEPVTIIVNHEGQDIEVTITYEYGNTPDHVETHTNKTWASESASTPGFEDGATVFPVSSWGSDHEYENGHFSFEIGDDAYVESQHTLIHQWNARLK